MTTPGGIPNLPVGALTLETLQSKLQDMSGGAMRSRAGERFPAIMGGSSGGSALSDLTPFGILTRIFSEFNSAVANADPADINGPDDLPELLLSFIENLPVIGEFVGLLEAILGTYDGDDEVLLRVQELFQFLRPDGMIDAGKLFGELPQRMINVLTALVSKLTGGLIELGQLYKPSAGQERNWLEPFDRPESITPDAWWSHDATYGRTSVGSAKVILDGAEHVQTSDPVDAAPGQALTIGGYVAWQNYTGSGPAFAIRVLAFSAGDQIVGSQLIGTVTPSSANTTDFETVMQATWTAPANTKYVRVRMEALAGATGGVAHFDDLWLRKPAQNLPQEWVAGLTSALSNLGDGISDAWNFVQATIDNFMNGRGILGSLFSLSHFQQEVGKVFGPGSAIPQSAITDLPGALQAIQSAADGAVDTAEGAIEAAAQLVIDGINNIGQVAGPIQGALESFVDAIFGSGTSSGSTPVVRWSQEVLLCAGPVVTGPNDIPLGFQSPFGAAITSINARTSQHASTGSGSKVVFQTLRNGTVIHTATWNGGNNSYTSGAINLTGINVGDVITFNVTEASSQMANMSITVGGKYT